MSIINRVSRLFKADLHGLLDLLEEPEIILKQAIREMQEEVEKTENNLIVQRRQQARMDKIHQELSREQAQLQQQISFSLDENEQLAKSLLRKKLESGMRSKAVEQQLQEIKADIELETKELEERKEKLQSIMHKTSLFSECFSNFSAEDQVSKDENLVRKTVTQEDVELAFLYQKKSQKGNEKQLFRGEKT